MQSGATFHLLTDVARLDPATVLEPAIEQCLMGARPQLFRYPAARAEEHIRRVFVAAQGDGGIVAHTLVDGRLRQAANTLSRLMNVPAIDLVGPVIVRLTDLLEVTPEARPELFHQMDEDYFRRVEAIEFAVAHDDGRRPHELDRAEIVLTGVSRTSKTPLSMYLATHGWLVANVPLMLDIEPPRQLFDIDKHKVFALTIRPERLVLIRQARVSRLGMASSEHYGDAEYVQQELAFGRRVLARGQWDVVNVSSKSIEECASEIIALRQRHYTSPIG
jgi:[pyruvate, water dikinase]-phosphate phosphotransferase / [pyruvate, water dikinase] kinase